MTSFQKTLLETKNISIWGIGYLGYTTILEMQQSGFHTTIYDFSQERLELLEQNRYPESVQVNTWSKNGKIPSLKTKNIDISFEPDALFVNKVHFISFPNAQKDSYKQLAKIFIENKAKLEDSLVIFQSAETPKTIEKIFYKELLDNDIKIDIATHFRDDWIVEDFFNDSSKRVIGGNSKEAIEKIGFLLKLLQLESIPLSSIEEAEIYANTKIAFENTIVGFFNQLSLSFPHINVNNLAKRVLDDNGFKDISLGVSEVDYRSEQAIENILRSSTGDYLSILEKANHTNISFLYFYVNLLKSKGIQEVTILGLSSYSTMKDLRFSPSVLLAEYLQKEHIKVYVHDENISKDELGEVLDGCEFIDIATQKIQTDAIIVMSLCKEYKFLTQKDIDNLDISKAKYIIDNTSFFNNFEYSDETVYHSLGDENLIKVMC